MNLFLKFSSLTLLFSAVLATQYPLRTRFPRRTTTPPLIQIDTEPAPRLPTRVRYCYEDDSIDQKFFEPEEEECVYYTDCENRENLPIQYLLTPQWTEKCGEYKIFGEEGTTETTSEKPEENVETTPNPDCFINRNPYIYYMFPQERKRKCGDQNPTQRTTEVNKVPETTSQKAKLPDCRKILGGNIQFIRKPDNCNYYPKESNGKTMGQIYDEEKLKEREAREGKWEKNPFGIKYN